MVGIAQSRWFLSAVRVGDPISMLSCRRVARESVPSIGSAINPLLVQDAVCAGVISLGSSDILSVIGLETETLGLPRQIKRFESMLVCTALQGVAFQQSVFSGQTCRLVLPQVNSGLVWLITSTSTFASTESTTLIAPYDRDELAKSKLYSAWPVPDGVETLQSPPGIGYVLQRNTGDIEQVASLLDPTSADMLSGLHTLSTERGKAVVTFPELKKLLEEVFLLGRKWAIHCVESQQRYR